jgi:general secretion pathway protein I
VGDTTSACEQAGHTLELQVAVRPTPNPLFRRVDAQVFEHGLPVLRVSTVQGRN